MTDPEFKPGDVVLMKMGGPHMTVETVRVPDGNNPNGTALIHCVWFDRNRRLRRDAFDDFTLKHVVSLP